LKEKLVLYYSPSYSKLNNGKIMENQVLTPIEANIKEIETELCFYEKLLSKSKKGVTNLTPDKRDKAEEQIKEIEARIEDTKTNITLMRKLI